MRRARSQLGPNYSILITPEYDDFVSTGEIKNNWFIAALSGLAYTYPKAISDLVVTKNYRNDGLIALNGYVRGVKKTFTIDDYLPFYG
jgi:hypothetical protein